MEHDGSHGASCPSCWAELTTPLFCESCRVLLPVDEGGSPFATLGLRPGFPVDKMALRKRLLALARQLHPDFHGSAGIEARRHAERNTAALNSAFEVLEDDFRRADWLLRSLDGPDENAERQMPPEFLAEVLEWNETIEEARDAAAGDPARAALPPLRSELQAQRARLMEEVSGLLDPLPQRRAPELAEIRRRLNAVRYLDRALHTIRELELEQASAPR